MSRVLVVGMGVPAFVPARRHAGPGLRSAHFARALADDGHDVLVLAVLQRDEEAPPPHEGGVEVLFAREDELAGEAVAARIRGFAPHAVVGATAYASALAVRLGCGVPLWADIFGDLMAEAQAKAARTGNDWSLVHFWGLLVEALEEADRFSAVSARQRLALLGQLGLAGRLGAATAGEELVATIPCAALETPRVARAAARRALGLSDDEFVVLCSGGLNTWCDVEALGEGLVAAMREQPRLRVVVTGGAIPGHDEQSEQVLRRLLEAAPPGRVDWMGWVEPGRLAAAVAASDLGLVVERRLVERELGAENRVAEWMAAGLPCATTAASECGAALAARGLVLEIDRREPAASLASVLAAAATPDGRSGLAAMAAAGREWAAAECMPGATARPLVAWCRNPVFAGDRGAERLVRLGIVTRPETKAAMLEAYVASIPARELVRRGLRWVARRLLRC